MGVAMRWILPRRARRWSGYGAAPATWIAEGVTATVSATGIALVRIGDVLVRIDSCRTGLNTLSVGLAAGDEVTIRARGARGMRTASPYRALAIVETRTAVWVLGDELALRRALTARLATRLALALGTLALLFGLGLATRASLPSASAALDSDVVRRPAQNRASHREVVAHMQRLEQLMAWLARKEAIESLATGDLDGDSLAEIVAVRRPSPSEEQKATGLRDPLTPEYTWRADVYGPTRQDVSRVSLRETRVVRCSHPEIVHCDPDPSSDGSGALSCDRCRPAHPEHNEIPDDLRSALEGPR